MIKAEVMTPKVAWAEPASLAPARRRATLGDAAAAAEGNKLTTKENL
jgi:hypothetical protein